MESVQIKLKAPPIAQCASSMTLQVQAVHSLQHLSFLCALPAAGNHASDFLNGPQLVSKFYSATNRQ